jgi:phage baseplate assembly protein W
MADPREVLGRGWAFPFRIHAANGGVAYSEFEENIRQNMTIIIGTRPGERQMLPDFGCRIHELIFAPNTSSTAAMISHHVKDALERWEERIEVTGVDAMSDPGGSIKVRVSYRIRATNALQSLSYTVSNR